MLAHDFRTAPSASVVTHIAVGMPRTRVGYVLAHDVAAARCRVFSECDNASWERARARCRCSALREKHGFAIFAGLRQLCTSVYLAPGRRIGFTRSSQEQRRGARSSQEQPDAPSVRIRQDNPARGSLDQMRTLGGYTYIPANAVRRAVSGWGFMDFH